MYEDFALTQDLKTLLRTTRHEKRYGAVNAFFTLSVCVFMYY